MLQYGFDYQNILLFQKYFLFLDIIEEDTEEEFSILSSLKNIHRYTNKKLKFIKTLGKEQLILVPDMD